MRVTVTTYAFRNDVIVPGDFRAPGWVYESQKVIDYGNSSDRKWLANHCLWAFHNSRKVETQAFDVQPIA